jgi:HK97 family phage prohead protease
MLQLSLPTEFKAFGDTGSFEGYAAIFGNIDMGGDVIERGAFKEIIKGRNGMVKILNQHRQADPIGTADVQQDDKGLAFKGQLILEAASARSAYALMKGGALDGMSIGFDVMPGGAEVLNSGVRQLKSLKLWEISPVTFGMNPMAGITGVKSINTIREFEDFLRDVGGFSHAAAKAIAAGGFKAPEPRDEDDADLLALVRRNISILKGN